MTLNMKKKSKDSAQPEVKAKKAKIVEKKVKGEKSPKVKVEKATKVKVDKKSGNDKKNIVKSDKKVGKENGPDKKKDKKDALKKNVVKKAGKENGGKDKKDALKKKVVAKKDDAKSALTKIEERKKQKELKQQRQKKKMQEKNSEGSQDVFELSVEAKQIWEKLRQKELKAEEKSQLCKELHQKLAGNIIRVVFAHDTVRVLESLICNSDDELRAKLFAETKDKFDLIAKSPYAHFFIVKLLKYSGKEIRADIFKHFEGRFAPLTKHKIAGNVIEELFNEYATALQRNRIMQEFYGPEFRHFKEEQLRTLKQLIEKFPEKKKMAIRYLAEHVQVLIKKGSYNHSMVHSIIYNYLANCEDEQKRAETIEQLRDACVHILHSHDGARAAKICLWHGTAKDRKAILKTFKTFIKKICLEEHGHTVLMAVFDCVDDTKLVAKAVIAEIIENLDEIAATESGRKVLMYLLAPRDKVHCCPDLINILKAGDGNANSKKDAEIRWRELKNSGVSAELCKFLLSKLSETLYDSAWVRLRLCALLHSEDSKALRDAVVEEAVKPFVPNEDQNIIEDAANHMMLKKLIQADKGKGEFSLQLLEAIDEDGLEAWITCNRGQFLLVAMIETEVAQVVEKVKEKVGKFTKTLKSQKTKGAEILRKKL